VLQKYLPSLKKMDDQTVEEWLEKAKNAEKVFAVTEEDNEVAKSTKES